MTARGTLTVPLPAGDTTVSTLCTPGADTALGTVLIAHGAGAGMEHPFQEGFAAAIAEAGFTSVRFNFPYLEQGRRMPGPPAHAIATWRAAVAEARQAGGPVYAVGKSYGGRMASMAAAEDAGLDVDRLIYLGYPLHAPGKPEKPRSAHLPDISQPQLFVEGTNDPFIQPLEQFHEVITGCRDAAVHWIDGGAHSFEVKGRRRPAEEIGAEIGEIVGAALRAAR